MPILITNDGGKRVSEASPTGFALLYDFWRKEMLLKLGRHEYEITRADVFMDNGACVQLLSQSKEIGGWGRKKTPVLSKRAVKEISCFDRLPKKHKYGDGVAVFSLDV